MVLKWEASAVIDIGRPGRLRTATDVSVVSVQLCAYTPMPGADQIVTASMLTCDESLSVNASPEYT